MKYAKFIAAALATVLTTLTAALPLVPATWKPWVEVGIAVVGAVAVRQVPNAVDAPGGHAEG